MLNGKHLAKTKTLGNSTVVIAMIVILALGIIGGTVALLVTATTPVVNVFEPTDVTCQVEKTTDGYLVRNTGSIPAYIRAAVVTNWTNTHNNICAEHSNLPITVTYANDSNWEKVGNYWYYKTPVPAGQTTAVLVTGVSSETTPTDGCVPEVVVLCSAIQSEPANAVTDAWGWTPGN